MLQAIHFRSLHKPKEDDFSLELYVLSVVNVDALFLIPQMYFCSLSGPIYNLQVI